MSQSSFRSEIIRFSPIDGLSELIPLSSINIVSVWDSQQLGVRRQSAGLQSNPDYLFAKGFHSSVPRRTVLIVTAFA